MAYINRFNFNRRSKGKKPITVKKNYPGCYRISDERNVEDPFSIFGQIYKDGRKWTAEIRYSSNGDIKRYAGIWNTKKDAIEEVVSIIEYFNN